jgi:hypothetical protein
MCVQLACRRMSLSTPMDPRTVWPLAYLSGRLGYRLTSYRIDGPDKDVVAVDLTREDTRVHVDWFPRTRHIMVSTDTGLVGVFSEFADMADALERL